MKLLFLFILFINTLVNGIELNSISPNYVEKTISGKLEVHDININVNILSNKTDNVMLFIGRIIEPYDRPPPESGYKYCSGVENLVVEDLEYQEKYQYSCCKKISKGNYTCPIPAADTELDPLYTILTEDVKSVYIKLVDDENEWILTDKTFTYKDIYTLEGIISKILLISLFVSICIFAVSKILGFMNFISNMYPLTTIIFHVLFLIISLTIEFFLLGKVKEDKTNRGKFNEFGLRFSILTLIYSIFMIYTPSKRDKQDPNTIEQRIVVEDTNITSSIIKFFKTKYVRNICCILFVILTFCQTISIFTLIDSLKEYFDIEWEMIVCLVIWYSILSILFLVSFVTAIYDIKIPIHFDEKTGQMIQVLPKTRYRREVAAQTVTRKVKPEYKGLYQNNYLVGLVKDHEIGMLNYDDISVGEIVAIDDDSENSDNPCSFLFWKVGYFEKGKLIIKNNLKKTVQTNCFSESDIIVLPKRSILDTIDLYQVIKIDSSNKYKYVKYGYIKNGLIHQNYEFLLRGIAMILKIVPDYSHDYNYNIVENIRSELNILTKNIGSLYGYIYMIGFTIFTIYALISEFFNDISVLNILLILCMTVFVIIINTKIKHKKNINKLQVLSKLLVSKLVKTRGNDELRKYVINSNWLNNLNYTYFSNFQTMKIGNYPGTKMLILDQNVENTFYFNFSIKSECSIIGLGIVSNNDKDVFNMLEPAIWYSSYNSEVAFKRNELVWIDETKKSTFNIGCGMIQNKIFFKTPDNKFFCFDYFKGKLALFIPEIVDLEIYKADINLKEDNGVIYLPDIMMDINQKISIEILQMNDVLINYNNNHDVPVDIAILKKEIVDLFNFENKEKLNSKYKNNLSREGILISLYSEIAIDKTPKEITYNLNLDNLKELPELVAFGLIEEEGLKCLQYNIIPGCKGVENIAYHSDDGSLIVSDSENNIIRKNSDLIWFNEGLLDYCIKVGFDGSSIYFVNKNKRFTVNNYDLLTSWKKGKRYCPVLYFHGNCNCNIKIDIDINIS